MKRHRGDGLEVCRCVRRSVLVENERFIIILLLSSYHWTEKERELHPSQIMGRDERKEELATVLLLQ